MHKVGTVHSMEWRGPNTSLTVLPLHRTLSSPGHCAGQHTGSKLPSKFGGRDGQAGANASLTSSAEIYSVAVAGRVATGSGVGGAKGAGGAFSRTSQFLTVASSQAYIFCAFAKGPNDLMSLFIIRMLVLLDAQISAHSPRFLGVSFLGAVQKGSMNVFCTIVTWSACSAAIREIRVDADPE